MSEDPTITAIREANRYFVQGPITTERLFIGRRKELSDALVMCQQIVAGATGGVLVVGGRGVGKTSFVEALRRGLAARGIPNTRLLSLDDSMAEKGKEYLFFKTVLAELVKTAYESGKLEEGLGRKVVNALTTMVDLDEIQVKFPALALVAKKGTAGGGEQFPAVYFRDGVEELLKKVQGSSPGTGFFLCMDEGDVLTSNRVLLQIMRNVFQHTPGAGVILAGTNVLLDQVNDVFSPIPRFFLKVDIGALSHEDVYNAVMAPLGATKDALRGRVGVDFQRLPHGGSEFIPTVERISERMPLDINLLCRYALEVGTRRFARASGGGIIVPMKIDYEVMRLGISQLRGTRDYADFIASLNDSEVQFLQFVAQADRRTTQDELLMMMYLNEMGRGLQEEPVPDICGEMGKFRSYLPKMEALSASVASKAKDSKVRAIRSGSTGRAGVEVEDQWVRAYFKFSVPKIWDNLETSSTITYEGVRVFGDPVSSVVHSMFFPRLRHAVTGKAEFRAHTGADEGDSIRIETGRKLIKTVYRRYADGWVHHLAFQVRGEEDLAEWLASIDLTMDALRDNGFIRDFTCREVRATYQVRQGFRR